MRMRGCREFCTWAGLGPFRRRPTNERINRRLAIFIRQIPLVDLCGTLLSFGIARAALGFGESGAFPASIKTVAEWFPRKERALATGIFNAGTNVGAIVTPLLVPWITVRYGWRWAFVATGAAGFV